MTKINVNAIRNSLKRRNKGKLQKCLYESSKNNNEEEEVLAISGEHKLKYNTTRTFDLSTTKVHKLFKAVIK